MSTPAWVSAIRARCAAAMPGPWVDRGKHEFEPLPFSITERQIMGTDASIYLRGATDAEMAFIAASRTDLPALLALCEGLAGALETRGHRDDCALFQRNVVDGCYVSRPCDCGLADALARFQQGPGATT